ncbi:hypothetical protein [Gordonia malaquae]|uniref:hypothetical protein n=1 Tax=Gordonia malaquae TaxID=410332 RepID=UPI003018B578
MTENLTLRAVARRVVAASAIAVFATLVLGTTAAAAAASGAPTTIGPITNPAEKTIAALVGDHPEQALTALPSDFPAVMGYRPGVEDGGPVNTTGDCSSPVPMPDRFEPLCRSHDFGYDLLRYGDRTGRPAAPWARLALDEMLVDAMHRSCSNPVCDAAASLAGVGLDANSWRQHWSAPVPESAGDMAASAALRVTESLAGRR